MAGLMRGYDFSKRLRGENLVTKIFTERKCRAKGKVKRKGPEVGMFLVCSRIRKKKKKSQYDWRGINPREKTEGP